MHTTGLFPKEILDKAKEYLFSEIPTKDYNKTFYEHKYFNKSNPYYKLKNIGTTYYPWWSIDGKFNEKEFNKELPLFKKESLEQRILFLRILIDKLKK